MANRFILEKEEVFTLEDYEALLCIYNSHKKIGVTHSEKDKDAILDFLNIYYHVYVANEINSKCLTEKQFYEYFNPLSKKTNALFNALKDDKMEHIFTRMVNGIINSDDIFNLEDMNIQPLTNHISENMKQLLLSLTWFQLALTHCRKENFSYLNTKSDTRAQPNTLFVQSAYKIITQFFHSGGYTRSERAEKKSSGWKIECIQCLLKKITISMTNDQVIDAITNVKKRNVKKV